MNTVLFRLLLKKELRHLTALFMPIFYFVMVMMLFPLATKAEVSWLNESFVMMAWVSVILAILLLAESFFKADYHAGIYQNWLLSKKGLKPIIMTKLIIKWFLVVFPMNLLAFCLAFLFKANFHQALYLLLSLMLGSPVIMLIALLMAVASLNTSLSSGLLAILTFPLVIPVLIFAGALPFSDSVLGPIYFLLAIFFFSIMTLPSVMAYLIKVSFE